jgi:hypothetical protein
LTLEPPDLSLEQIVIEVRHVSPRCCDVATRPAVEAGIVDQIEPIVRRTVRAAGYSALRNEGTPTSMRPLVLGRCKGKALIYTVQMVNTICVPSKIRK